MPTLMAELCLSEINKHFRHLYEGSVRVDASQQELDHINRAVTRTNT